MRRYLMISKVTMEVEDDDMEIMEALDRGEMNITESRMSMVDLDTSEIIIDDVDIIDGVDFKDFKG